MESNSNPNAPSASPAPARGGSKPGEHLRRLRAKLSITAREVEELSRKIAAEQGNDEFIISHGRIIQVENDESTPSIYKLATLSAIYDIPLPEMLSMFIDLDRLTNYRIGLRQSETRLIKAGLDQPEKPIAFPVRFDPGFNLNRTGMLSRLIETWGELPPAFLQQLNLKSMQYGLVGLNDYTMSPLIKPGSFVQIDDSQRKPAATPQPPASEYDRPIYFVELRDEYLCGWCELQKNQLLVIPHPLSPCRIRVLAYPNEAEIVGRIVAIAARIAPLPAGSTSSQGPATTSATATSAAAKK